MTQTSNFFRFLAWLFLWSFVGFFYATQIYMNSPGGHGWIEALKTAMPRWYIWGLLSPGMFWADRQLSGKASQLSKRVLFHIPICIGWMLIFATLNTLTIGVLEGEFPEISFSFIINHFYWNLLIYWLIMGVYWIKDYYTEFKEQELKSTRLERNLTEARLQALQDRLHPHFLFNALNTISAYMEKDAKTARRMIANLAELLRFSLDHTKNQKISLAQELFFLDCYLEIEQMRFNDQLTVHRAVDPDAMEVQVPSFILQPLVENSIRHGINPRNAPGSVEIRIKPHNGQLHIKVKDDGVGLPESFIINGHSGVGISNTTERLKQIYGQEHHFSINNRPGNKGVVVDIKIPFHSTVK